MNFTGGNTLPNIGKRINWQLITLLGGLAVAFSVGALAGAFEGDEPATSTAVTQPAAQATDLALPSSPTSGGGAMELVYIIVGSEEEAATLRGAVSSYADAMPELAPSIASTHIVAVETRDDQRQFDQALAVSASELMAADVGVRVVDLRDGSLAGNVDGPSPVNAATSASVASSTRPVVYIVGSEDQAARIRWEMATDEMLAATEGYGFAARPASFLVIESEDQYYLYNTMVGEQMANGAFDIVDLR